MSLRRLAPPAAAMLPVLLLLLTATSARADLGVPGRAADPIVLTGADVPKLSGSDPDEVVAFSWDDRWIQVPVQVDERAVVDYGVVRQIGNGFDHEAYTDPGTFAGADPDPTLDAGDEIAFMAMDAGSRADGVAGPDGVEPATRTAVAIDDPLEPGTEHVVYLFRTDAGLDPAAGRSYVDYDFSLNSGDYRTSYDFDGVANVEADAPPANPEDSTVTTSAYTQHLLARWVTDRMTLRTGAAPSPDILDGDKAQVSRGCGRSELTFSRGGGGFIANISGPVRAIRSQIGANSGTYTQRDDIYYQRRQDTLTYLRVHAGIGQISQFRDYSANAIGMTYRNSAYPAGVTIDGVPDAGIPVPAGSTTLQPATEWEQVSGPDGSLAVVTRVDTNLPGYTPGSFYRDQGSSPTFGQCGGYADALSYGSSGSEFKSNADNTDPTLGPAYGLTATRSTFFDEPGAGAAEATLRSDQIDAPLEATVTGEQEPSAPALNIHPRGSRKTIRPGGSARIPVVVVNTGEGAADDLEVCAKVPRRVGHAGRCKSAVRLAAGDSFRTKLRITAARTARRFIRVRYRVSAENAKSDKAGARIGIRR
ncbi:MAG TPA: hypothetical protein VHI96_02670 [Solirubrobacterales bacterium]|nr:hypothetical protein [Solirubrobacterales bacterium]